MYLTKDNISVNIRALKAVGPACWEKELWIRPREIATFFILEAV